ncbi:MAG: tRNA pseudouridine(55) synthase TruB [Firmicutes bacterium]|nr:tRNA pseudouridine(55) synthase TruB [Bacillota bacterium]
MQGILNILKAPGMTSHDMVAAIRRKFGVKRVGHGGTLDPPAAGILVLMLGKATRLSEYVTEMDKTYRGEITFGVRTDTQDATGSILTSHPVELTAYGVEEAFAHFTGRIEQVPPMVSAVKQGGKRLYQLARRGETIRRPSRPVTIKRLELIEFSPGEEGYPRALFECHCSKGTYIRTLAADIGEHLACGAHLSFLLRTAVGPFEIDDSWLWEEIKDCSHLSQCLLPLTSVLGKLPRVIIKPRAVESVSHGNRLYPAGIEDMCPPLAPDQIVRLEQPAGNLIALARWVEGTSNWYFHPYKVFQEL